MANVIALDLATTTGWALHTPGMERPFFGTVRLPGKAGDIGRRCEALRLFLADQHKMHKLTHIVFEAQHVAAKMDIDTLCMLLALGGMAEWFAHRCGIRIFKSHISEWRKHFLGRGSGFKDTSPKELAIRKCAEFGWYIDVHDAAEACGVLDHFLSMLPGDPQRPWRDANFMGAHLRG